MWHINLFSFRGKWKFLFACQTNSSTYNIWVVKAYCNCEMCLTASLHFYIFLGTKQKQLGYPTGSYKIQEGGELRILVPIKYVQPQFTNCINIHLGDKIISHSNSIWANYLSWVIRKHLIAQSRHIWQPWQIFSWYPDRLLGFREINNYNKLIKYPLLWTDHF